MRQRMHVQHLAVMIDGWWGALLCIEGLLEDGESISRTSLFEIHISIHGD
jgi:hypothetical protein